MKREAAIWVLLAVVLVPAVARAISAGDKCEADKLKTAGKYAFCRLKAEAKAVKTNTAPDYSKCDEKYGDKWGVVEGKAAGACPVTGDAAMIQTQASGYTDLLTAAIAGSPVTPCGDGVVDAGEDCDLGDLAGASCVTEGFAGGVLSCGAGCVFDTGGCWAARFVDNADGTITDNQGGLMWEKKTALNSVQNLANVHDADNSYLWSGTCTVNTSKLCQPTAAASTLCAANVVGTPDGCAECTGGDGTCNQATTLWTAIADLNAASFAGYSDWRAATVQELQDIVEYADSVPPAVDAAFHGASCGAACTDLTSASCSCTRSGFYWSGTTYESATIYAWWVYFSDGTVSADFKPFQAYHLRAVRGGS